MLKDKNFLNEDNRNLSEVFRELQEAQKQNIEFYNVTNQYENTTHNNYEEINENKPNTSTKKTSSKKSSYKQSFGPNDIYPSTDLKLSHIIIGCSILVITMAILFPKSTSFKESYAKVEEPENITEFELNRHRLNMQNIISENSDMDKVKEQVVEEREVAFETTYTNNSTRPKGEEIVVQEGALGKDSVTAVKTYENGNFVEEIILGKESIEKPVEKIIDIGTSDFLAKHKVHLEDTMYLIDKANLKESADDSSNDIAEIKASLDVKLLELPNEEWCKVSFDSVEGYIKTSQLTSSHTTPNIVEKNRIQRILIKVNIDMELNKTSGLTLNDYKKIFTNLPGDTKKVFQDNYTVFYNIEKKYNINGIFLASMAIHESSWGTSQIATEKKNLFGYGSYDATPYESSFEFDSYAEGIETVAKSLVKYYLNPSGTKIYDGETAVAWYYNGPTLIGVNTRYASDSDWHKKVYSYMELLYNRL